MAGTINPSDRESSAPNCGGCALYWLNGLHVLCSYSFGCTFLPNERIYRRPDARVLGLAISLARPHYLYVGQIYE